jgi:hypothetical protein
VQLYRQIQQCLPYLYSSVVSKILGKTFSDGEIIIKYISAVADIGRIEATSNNIENYSKEKASNLQRFSLVMDENTD